jgi:hypothetical protein
MYEDNKQCNSCINCDVGHAFYGDIFSAVAQVSAKSLMPMLLSSLGIAS